ncbi:MAG: thermonuclease family protein [Rubrivivax sp.]
MKSALLRLVVLAVGVAVGLAVAGAAGSATAAPAVLSGVVTKVLDGDTLVVQPAGRAPLEVRLRDIDAPESCQAWGAEARQALEEMALGKTVELRTHARDAYGRVVGSVSVEGEDLGRRMVVEGHAWSTRSKWDLGPLVKQERQARALGRGLHATAGALQPREFRRLHGPCARR